MDAPRVKVILFDVFGTVVDWRTSISRALAEFGGLANIDADWTAVADAWRGEYRPSMQEVLSGRRQWVPLDTLNRESLARVFAAHDIRGVGAHELDQLARAWRSLDPWPDSRHGLTRLRAHLAIGTLSNGNTDLLTDMAEYANLPWDVILGAETAQSYKPDPTMYLDSVARLGRRPHEVMLAAAHNDDLEAAASCGLRTAFILRPREYGPNQTTDLEPSGDWDLAVESIEQLADRFDAVRS